MIRKQYIAFIIYGVLILFLGLCSSCSCNYHLRKAQAKCGAEQLNDTLVVHDTILVDKVTTDTIFRSELADTVYINKDRLHIKYVRLSGDSVYIQGKCDTVFVARIIKKPYTKTIIKNELSWWQKFRMHLGDIILFFLVILLIYGAWQLTRK